jgi:tetraacyldisaccharide 4'-kinase
MLAQRFIQRHLHNITPVSLLLYPFSLIWGLIQKVRRTWWRYHPGERAEVRVISVGNITAGGSGKTPFTIYLAEYLRAKGKRIAVSHRGYKGDYENEARIISTREVILPEAASAGDEARLLAESLQGIPVCTGKKRVRAIELLMKCYPDLEIVILDDSYQHFKVVHDIDIVIFKLPAPIGNGFLHPAGILREPLSALKDADLIIINGRGEIPDFLHKYHDKICQGEYVLEDFFLNGAEVIKLSTLQSAKIGLISGIANPAGLEDTLSSLGFIWEFHCKFPDHYHYKRKQDVSAIEREIAIYQVEYLVTTEKDYTKLKDMKISIPVAVIKIRFNLVSGRLSDIV